MRVNLPVTAVEYELAPDAALVEEAAAAAASLQEQAGGLAQSVSLFRPAGAAATRPATRNKSKKSSPTVELATANPDAREWTSF